MRFATVEIGGKGQPVVISPDGAKFCPVTTLIFDIPTIIATSSAGITLQPGDVIATGTPAGVGIGFKPPGFLKPGDTMTIRIDGLGTLTNTIAN